MGHNTFPNLIPLLTGLSVDELTATCWSSRGQPLDSCPFIWEAPHLRSLYAEDIFHWSTFNFHKFGFSTPPTDHYFRTFLGGTVRSPNRSSSRKDSICPVCLKNSPQPVIEHILSYIKSFLIAYPSSEAKFAFTWINCPMHEDLNGASRLDSYFYRFLTDHKIQDQLKDSFIILMSDHGVRWGKPRWTHQGLIDARTPLLMIAAPPRFQTEFPTLYHHLIHNQGSLISPFDLHHTLKQIINLHSLITPSQVRRPDSLLTPIYAQKPSSRSCEMARIPAQFCPCNLHQLARVDKFDDDENLIVESAATSIIDVLNDKLRAYHQRCHQLALNSILLSRLFRNVDDYRGPSSSFSYRLYLIFQVLPNHAAFEAVVHVTSNPNNNSDHDKNNRVKEEEEEDKEPGRPWTMPSLPYKFDLLGKVIRVSKSDPRHCMRIEDLEDYCACK